MQKLILLSAASLALAVIAAPGAELVLSEGETERDAVLLECCDLPDKGLTLSEGDLDGIVSRFAAPVPLMLEHIETPLGPLGTVQRIWRDGRRLLGRVTFAPDVAGLVRARGCKSLSCGLARAPLALAELSLVLKPRVAAAVLLSDDDAAELVRLRADNARILAENVTRRVDAQITDLKRAGKIVPATEAAARVLLSAGDANTVTLAEGGSQAVSAAFLAYLTAQPAVVKLSEYAEVDAAAVAEANRRAGESAETFTAEEADFLTNRLGVDPAAVAETLKAEGRSLADAR